MYFFLLISCFFLHLPTNFLTFFMGCFFSGEAILGEEHCIQEEYGVRQSEKETFAQDLNRKLFSVDFHDFLEKESTLNDVEMSREFNISVRDVQHLRRKRK
jgi:hypothetical protein